MHSTLLRSIALALLLLAPTSPAGAQLFALYRAELVDYDGTVQDCDSCVFCGLPVCELYFEVGIGVSGSISPLETQPNGCPTPGFFSLDDGVWNFSDFTIERQLPDLATSADFVFALYDRDDSDDDDLLGSHAITRSAPISSVFQQNNDVLAAGYAPQPCGSSTDDTSRAAHFAVQYTAWFEDRSGPLPPSPPSHVDSANTGWDDDAQLDFVFSPGTDPNSGIANHRLQVREESNPIFDGLLGPAVTSFTICDQGCTVPHAVADGATYTAEVFALNGSASAVAIINPQFAGSGSSGSVVVDLLSPTSAILSPPSGSEQAGDFDVTWSDADAHPITCEIAVMNDAQTPGASDWSSRACSAPRTVTVGPGSTDCPIQGGAGEEVCRVWGRTTDAAGRTTLTHRSFAIFYTPQVPALDPLGTLVVAGILGMLGAAFIARGHRSGR